MPFTPGTRLGIYDVTAQIGAGGMGEVYRARDTRLGRDVALKVLPESFVSDPERVARFQREAKTLASLNHPNIGGIHGLEESDGVIALVLELVEGPTLADRIARGPICLDEALPIATAIVDALAAAHEQGIVHRDLKPANIKLRHDGTVKVLDFGLAKMIEPAAATASSRSLSPTISTPAMTQAGVILGTAAYMSPEQARGRAADKRSDIWAFGSVVYEMLAGKRAFASDGDTVSDVVAAVLKSEPDWNALPPSTPAAIRRMLRRCLEKDATERLHDIADARLEIRDARREDVRGPARVGTDRLAWSVAGGLALMSLGLAALLFGRPAARAPESSAAYRSVILPPATDANAAASEARTGVPRFGRGLALSPDGRRLAFVAPGPDGRTVLWVRPLDAVTAQALAGTEGADSPFWSADGRHVGFVVARKLKRIDASGGPVLTLYDGARSFSTGTWNRDNVILFAGEGTILRISSAGGSASPVTSRDASQEPPHDSPFFLPDGRRFLYSVNVAGAGGGGTIVVGSLESTERTKLRDGGSLPVYANGYLLFVRDDTLMAQRFDADRLELTGDAMPLAEQLMIAGAPSSSGVFAVSESGVLVYQAGVIPKSALVWFDRSGRELGVLSEPSGFSYVQLSPDQRHAVVSLYDDATRTRDLWLYDTARSGRIRLTDDPSDDFSAAWSPNGDRIAFVGRRAGDRSLNVYEKGFNGSGGERRLLDREGIEIPTSWSPDGAHILYQTQSPGADVWVLPLAANSSVRPFANSRFTEASAQFSPDGQWVAYSSNESGRTEVYAAPFQRAGPRVPISTDGGGSPRWRPDGKALFYIRGDNTLMEVAIRAGETGLDVGAATALFQTRFRTAALSYAVTTDGRFLVNRAVDDMAATPIHLVVNWPAALKN